MLFLFCSWGILEKKRRSECWRLTSCSALSTNSPASGSWLLACTNPKSISVFCFMCAFLFWVCLWQRHFQITQQFNVYTICLGVLIEADLCVCAFWGVFFPLLLLLLLPSLSLPPSLGILPILLDSADSWQKTVCAKLSSIPACFFSFFLLFRPISWVYIKLIFCQKLEFLEESAFENLFDGFLMAFFWLPKWGLMATVDERASIKKDRRSINLKRRKMDKKKI